jgi:hypothetical protein
MTRPCLNSGIDALAKAGKNHEWATIKPERHSRRRSLRTVCLYHQCQIAGKKNGVTVIVRELKSMTARTSGHWGGFMQNTTANISHKGHHGPGEGPKTGKDWTTDTYLLGWPYLEPIRTNAPSPTARPGRGPLLYLELRLLGFRNLPTMTIPGSWANNLRYM